MQGNSNIKPWISAFYVLFLIICFSNTWLSVCLQKTCNIIIEVEVPYFQGVWVCFNTLRNYETFWIIIVKNDVSHYISTLYSLTAIFHVIKEWNYLVLWEVFCNFAVRNQKDERPLSCPVGILSPWRGKEIEKIPPRELPSLAPSRGKGWGKGLVAGPFHLRF